jgi:phospholipase C
MTHTYQDGDMERRVFMPKGDVFRVFREDVRSGRLPTVSWLVAPERFSDHPGSAWYGAWYIAEALNILTENPDIWKKTIFILTYDENDGYFDHVPPFVAPHPRRPETGRVSGGIDTAVDYVDREEEERLKRGSSARASSIGLGYRVPMIIASPWSRGGCVCSQVFDHTSVLQFLEKLLTHKTGRAVDEPNISRWRRTVCGDLTSAFQTNHERQSGLPPVTERTAVIEAIHRAKFKDPPRGFRSLSTEEINQLRDDRQPSPLLPRQEPGVRRSCPLPYELFVDGGLNVDRTRFVIRFEASNRQFAKLAAGSPFVVYARTGRNAVEVRDYAIAAGTQLEDSWPLKDFENGDYHLCVYGPNGFFREFRGTAESPKLETQIRPARQSEPTSSTSGDVEIHVTNRENHPCDVEITALAYNAMTLRQKIAAGRSVTHVIEAQQSFGWYDFNIRAPDDDRFEHRFAGRIETGKWSFSDPLIGRRIG